MPCRALGPADLASGLSRTNSRTQGYVGNTLRRKHAPAPRALVSQGFEGEDSPAPTVRKGWIASRPATSPTHCLRDSAGGIFLLLSRGTAQTNHENALFG